MRKVLILMFVCVGCMPETYEPECWMQREAELVALAYEDKYDAELDDSVFTCMHDFQVGWVATDKELGDLCDPGILPSHEEAWGCHFYQDRWRGNIIFSRDFWDNTDTFGRQTVLRHELTHNLLMCMGHEQREHRALFNYSGNVFEPESLAMYAASIVPEDLYDECL